MSLRTPLSLFALVALAVACQGGHTADSARADLENTTSAGAPELSEATGSGASAVPVPEPEAPLPAPRPPTRSVFDLVANRHLAHRQVGGALVLEAGAPDFARYTHGNRDRDWVYNETHDGHPVAIPRNRTPTLYVPLTTEQAAAVRSVTLDLWYGSGRYPIALELGERSLGEQAIPEGWQQVVLELPEGALHAGENEIVLSLPSDAPRSGSRVRAALERVTFGSRGPAAPALAEPDAASPPPPWGQAQLALGSGRSLAWYTVLPEHAWLRVRAAEASPSCGVHAAVTRASGESTAYELAFAELSEGRPAEVRLEGAPVGEVVRLELGAGEACPSLVLDEASVRTEGEELVVPTFEPPRNIVVWLIDTLRADRLTSINPDTRVIAPALDRFAREGAVFTRAYVQGNESFASHAALFAGRYPEAIGVLSSADHVQEDEVLLAEMVRSAGLRTGGYSANGHINEGNGFLQGFDGFTNTLREHLRYQADGMLDHANGWIDAHGEERFYLYIGTVDCHVTYRAREDILPLYDPDPYEGRFRNTVGGDELGEIKVGRLIVTERDKIRIEAIYDNTVTWSDRHFGLFLDHLERAGRLDDTLVIVTSDHGDEFWEHGSVGHGHNVHEELVHVPLIMRYPGAIPAGTVVRAGVDTIDLQPTLAEMLGVEAPARAQGESLLPLIYGVGADYPRPAVSQTRGATHAMSLDRWKVIWLSNGRRRLYDLETDPTEQLDVGGENAYALRFVSDAMGLFMAYRDDWSKADWGVASNLLPGFGPD